MAKYKNLRIIGNRPMFMAYDPKADMETWFIVDLEKKCVYSTLSGYVSMLTDRQAKYLKRRIKMLTKETKKRR